jgi:predicted deacetylase
MKLLIRLDDFSPNRNVEAWDRVETILDRCGVRPLVAVIPGDRYFGTAATNADFWAQVRRLEGKGWAIGLHGDTHLVVPIAPGAQHEIFFATKSEFVGLPFESQVRKLESAWQQFLAHGVRPVAFVAPNHGFDADTVRAVVQNGNLRFMGDGIGLRLYVDRGLVWLPQIDWRIPRLRFGFRSACLHPSTMTASEIDSFAARLASVAHYCISLSEIEIGKVRERGLNEALFERAFKLYFKIKEALGRALHGARALQGPMGGL